MTTRLLLPSTEAQKIIDYLKMRPYQEVYALIAALLCAQREDMQPVDAD